jgi:hypothetical protein
MDDRKKQIKAGKDKSPYLRREQKDTKKAFKSVEKSVNPVAKDTNKTRRKETKARIIGVNAKKVEKPNSTLKRDMKKPIGKKDC